MNLATAISTDSPKVFFSQNRLVTTSKAIAEYFDKQHKDVLRKIDNLDCSPEFTSAHFCAHAENQLIGVAEREVRYYEITKDGFMFLVMGFTGKKAARLKEAYFNAFNRMEAELHRFESRDIIQGDGHSLLIHFDRKTNQISYTEQVPSDAIVATVERVRGWMEKQGYRVMSKDEIKNMTLAQLLALK